MYSLTETSNLNTPDFFPLDQCIFFQKNKQSCRNTPYLTPHVYPVPHQKIMGVYSGPRTILHPSFVVIHSIVFVILVTNQPTTDTGKKHNLLGGRKYDQIDNVHGMQNDFF